MLQEHLLHFFNFVGTFGDGSVNDRIHFMAEKVLVYTKITIKESLTQL